MWISFVILSWCALLTSFVINNCQPIKSSMCASYNVIVCGYRTHIHVHIFLCVCVRMLSYDIFTITLVYVLVMSLLLIGMRRCHNLLHPFIYAFYIKLYSLAFPLYTYSMCICDSVPCLSFPCDVSLLHLQICHCYAPL